MFKASSTAEASSYLLFCLWLLLVSSVAADETSARAAMEDLQNPLVQITTTEGNIFIEMLVNEAPRNVANFLALAAGEIAIEDPESGQVVAPNYYDGMTFHRIIPDLLIQSGSPADNEFGGPVEVLPDEINANALGLDRMPAVLADGSFNPVLQIGDREDLEELILIPLYRTMDISSNAEVTQRQYEIDQRLRAMTVKQVYENLGYRYTERYSTRPIVRGTVGLANSGPDDNGPEFFIVVNQAQWLNGRYTVIGRVVEGMEVVDRINQVPLEQTPGSPGILIQRIREL